MISGLGAVLFGLLIGWLAYWILRLRAGAYVLSELLTLLGVLGGAAVMFWFKEDALFGWYAIGLVRVLLPTLLLAWCSTANRNSSLGISLRDLLPPSPRPVCLHE